MMTKSARWIWVAGMAAGLMFLASHAIGAETTKAADKPDKKPDKTEKAGKIVVFRFHGPLLESSPKFEFGFEMEPKRTLHDLLDRFRKAKKDDTVKAMVLTFDRPQIGWAQMQEIRKGIADLREAKKDVYCYLEEAGSGIYQLATACTRVAIAPTGDIDLVGLHIEEAYFKGLLDKIGLEADIEHVGAYKGAGEPFTRTGPSDEAKEMMNWLVDDLFDQMVSTVAEARSLKPEEVRKLIDRGPFNAKQAKEAKLVDEVCYAEELTRSLKEKYGEDAEFVHNYGGKKGPDVDLSSPFAFFKLFGEAMNKTKAAAKPSVAVICVNGMIVSGKPEEGIFGESSASGSTTIRRLLNKARNDDSVKAVVLRVDSPGGSALASDIMWHAAEELGQAKPLIVSMGDVAASGGYYISAGARAIFADPGTLTGSIGVIGGKLVSKGLWDWAGVSFHETSRGQNADLFNSNRKFDDRQREVVRQQMMSSYNEFTDRVKKGRGQQLKAKGKNLDDLSGGRVYTGRQALANGLVDKLGGLDDAIKYAAAQANVSDYEIRLLPEPRNFFDIFVRSLRGEEDDDDQADVSAQAAQPRLLSPPSLVRELLPLIQSLDPQRGRTVLRSLLRIELLGREHTLLVLPGELSVR